MMQSVFTFILYRVILDKITALICLDIFGALLLLTSFVWSITSVYYYRWHVMRCVGPPKAEETKIGRSITAKRILLVVYLYKIEERKGKENVTHIGDELLKIDLLKYNHQDITLTRTACGDWVYRALDILLTSMLIIYFTWSFIFICIYFLTFERIIPTAVKPQNPESFFKKSWVTWLQQLTTLAQSDRTMLFHFCIFVFFALYYLWSFRQGEKKNKAWKDFVHTFTYSQCGRERTGVFPQFSWMIFSTSRFCWNASINFWKDFGESSRRHQPKDTSSSGICTREMLHLLFLFNHYTVCLDIVYLIYCWCY